MLHDADSRRAERRIRMAFCKMLGRWARVLRYTEVPTVKTMEQRFRELPVHEQVFLMNLSESAWSDWIRARTVNESSFSQDVSTES